MHRAGRRIGGDELDPLIDDELGDLGLPSGHGQQRLRRGVDDQQQPHRLVNLHHLQWKAGPQIALVAVHHADQPGDVVRQLGPAPEALRISLSAPRDVATLARALEAIAAAIRTVRDESATVRL